MPADVQPVTTSAHPTENGAYQTRDVLLAMLMTAVLITSIIQVIFLFRLDTTLQQTRDSLAANVEVSLENNSLLREQLGKVNKIGTRLGVHAQAAKRQTQKNGKQTKWYEWRPWE
jgi:hypothetical protein